jgi:hypothetical protein
MALPIVLQRATVVLIDDIAKLPWWAFRRKRKMQSLLGQTMYPIHQATVLQQILEAINVHDPAYRPADIYVGLDAVSIDAILILFDRDKGILRDIDGDLLALNTLYQLRDDVEWVDKMGRMSDHLTGTQVALPVEKWERLIHLCRTAKVATQSDTTENLLP